VAEAGHPSRVMRRAGPWTPCWLVRSARLASPSLGQAWEEAWGLGAPWSSGSCTASQKRVCGSAWQCAQVVGVGSLLCLAYPAGCAVLCCGTCPPLQPDGLVLPPCVLAGSEVGDARGLGLLQRSFPQVNFAALGTSDAMGDLLDKAPVSQLTQTEHSGPLAAAMEPPATTTASHPVKASCSEAGVQCDELPVASQQSASASGSPVAASPAPPAPSDAGAKGGTSAVLQSALYSRSSGTMAVVGQDAGGGASTWKEVVTTLWEHSSEIAHDMKNPLNGVLALSQNVIQVRNEAQ
jgi:hypothetical protein